MLSPVCPTTPESRRRSNSLSSAYGRRRFSGISSYDDTSAYAHITDIENARFKAISDSFQNSRLKLRKLPTIPETNKRVRLEDEIGSASGRDLDESSTDFDGRDASCEPLTGRRQHMRRGSGGERPRKRANRLLAQALSNAIGDIVILGGYRGSILKQSQSPHRQLWVPMKTILKNRKVDLEVGLSREDEERMEESIVATGIISHIGPIDICRRLLKQMRKCPNSRENKLRVHDWGWDWRLSPNLLSGKLITFLESLECNHTETPVGKRGAIVIAHSLGGLITRHAVNQRPDLFAGVIYAGVPQHCINILGPLRNGDDVLFNSKILTAQVNFTLRTSFALLPEDGRCFIEKHTNKRFDLDFFDPEVWEEYRLCPCINPPLQPRTEDNNKKMARGISLRKSLTMNGSSSSSASQQSRRPSAGPPQAVEGVNDNLRATGITAEATTGVEGLVQETVEPSMKPSRRQRRIALATTIPKCLAKEYLQRTLAEVFTFKQQLNFKSLHEENNAYPPHAVIFSKTLPTVLGVKVADMDAIKYNDAFDDLAFAAGDGVVLASAAQLPEGYRYVHRGRVESDRGHIGLMGDLEGMSRCLEAVISGRAKGVGLGRGYAGQNLSGSAEP